MKKILSILLVTIILSLNVLAAPTVNSYGPEEVVTFDESFGSELAQEYIELGQSLRRTRLYKYLTISHYYQDGEIWSNDIMQTAGDTIGQSGCGVCSFAMILRSYGITANPRQVNNTIGASACPFDYTGAATAYSLSVSANRYLSSNDEGINFIIGAIANDQPVMVYMVNGNHKHFVAAYGYSGSTISIKDPEPAWDYSTLNQYINAGWTLRRVITFE